MILRAPDPGGAVGWQRGLLGPRNPGKKGEKRSAKKNYLFIVKNIFTFAAGFHPVSLRLDQMGSCGGEKNWEIKPHCRIHSLRLSFWYQ